MVYHSAFNDAAGVAACGFAILPLVTATRGPAMLAEQDSTDIVEEALYNFRANVLFRTYDVKGPADKTLIYLTLYISACLKRLDGVKTKSEGSKALFALAQEHFSVPGEANFALQGLALNSNKDEAEQLRAYWKQCREEVGLRLVERCFDKETGAPNKWWMSYSNRKFLGKTL